MTYSELLQKVLSGTIVCSDNDTYCIDCPYVNSSGGSEACQNNLLHDKNILINIMKYLDKIQEEAKENG